MGGEHWLGLHKISCLTQVTSVLRIDLEAFNGDIGYAEYNKFQVGSTSTNYVLRIGGFSGSIGELNIRDHVHVFINAMAHPCIHCVILIDLDTHVDMSV